MITISMAKSGVSPIRARTFRALGLARATTKIGLANLVHNMRRLLWLKRQPALA